MTIDLAETFTIPIEKPDGKLVWVEVTANDAEQYDDYLDVECCGGGFAANEDCRQSEAEWLEELIASIGIYEVLGDNVLDKIKNKNGKTFRIYGKLHAWSSYDSWNGDYDGEEYFEVHKIEEAEI